MHKKYFLTGIISLAIVWLTSIFLTGNYTIVTRSGVNNFILSLGLLLLPIGIMFLGFIKDNFERRGTFWIFLIVLIMSYIAFFLL